MIPLGSSNIMKETDQFLTDQILLKEREVLYGVEDGSVKVIEWLGGLRM